MDRGYDRSKNIISLSNPAFLEYSIEQCCSWACR
jgi:hypothetical protein